MRKIIDPKFAVVAAICFLLAAGSAYMLWRDFNDRGEAGQGLPMAHLEKSRHKVKRRPKASYRWSSARPHEDFFQKDSVQTAAKSAAAIRMNDGSLLEMGENSLIVIDEVGNLSLNYVRGQMVLRTATGDSKLSAGADGVAKVESFPVRLVRPEALAHLFTQNEKSADVYFSWEAKGAKLPERFTVEISRSAHFKPEQTTSISNADPQQLAASSALEPGRYYWRVVDAGKPLSAVGQFDLAHVEPLVASWPNPLQKTVSWGAESALQFRWIAPKGFDSKEDLGAAVEHRVQVSQDASFQKLALNERVSGASANTSLSGLKPGDYFWRVQSRYGDIVMTSNVEQFHLDRVQTVTLELGSPDENGSLAEGKPTRFNWSTDLNDGDYVFELESVDQSAQAPKFNTRVKAKVLEWNKPVEGRYRWRVSAMVDQQKVGETPWRALAVYRGAAIQLKSPKKDQEIYWWDNPVPFRFEWEKDETAQAGDRGYLLEVAKDAQFTSVAASFKTRETSVSDAQLQLSSGAYFWRVKVVDAKGAAFKSSETFRLSYGLHPPLRAPAVARPAPGAVLNLLGKDTDAKAVWSKIDGAEGYEFTVTRADPTKAVVLSTITKDPEAPLKELKSGRYYWTVRPLDKLNRRGAALPTRIFSITYGELLPAPETTSPEVQ